MDISSGIQLPCNSSDLSCLWVWEWVNGKFSREIVWFSNNAIVLTLLMCFGLVKSREYFCVIIESKAFCSGRFGIWDNSVPLLFHNWYSFFITYVRGLKLVEPWFSSILIDFVTVFCGTNSLARLSFQRNERCFKNAYQVIAYFLIE